MNQRFKIDKTIKLLENIEENIPDLEFSEDFLDMT